MNSNEGTQAGTESVMQVGGQGLAGLLVRAVGAAGGLFVDTLSFCVSAVCLWRIRTPADAPDRDEQDSLSRQISKGVGLVASDPYLRVLTLIGGTSNFGLTGINTLAVIFCLHTLQVNPSAVGYVLALGSTGAAAGAAESRRVGSGRASTGLTVASGFSALLIPFATPGAGSEHGTVGHPSNGVVIVQGALELERLVE